MYWPIGAPNVYALSKIRILDDRLARSYDGLNNPETEASSPHNGQKSGSELAAGILNGPDEERGQGQRGGQGGPSQTQEASDAQPKDVIIDAKISRGGGIFVTITGSSLTVWQAKPVVALAGVERSQQSLKAYGLNVAVLLRPDALLVVVQTQFGFLITYSLTTDPNAKVYQTHISEATKPARRPSVDGYSQFRRSSAVAAGSGPGEGDGIREVNLRFRMVIRIDAGISRALALEDEIIVATQKPPALQCIRWIAENGSPQTSTELVSRIPWLVKKSNIVEMVYDKPMNLATWITNDGCAYAVQRSNTSAQDPDNRTSLFQGFCFREPESERDAAVKVSINARFSLIAIGRADGCIDVYVVKDYTGNIPLSHQSKLPVAPASHGRLTCLKYSLDGYCLFASYEKGWATWSVYGKPGAHTFSNDRAQAQLNDEPWLGGIGQAFWLGGSCELALLPQSDDRLWFVDMARIAATGCFTPANVSRGLLHSSNSIMIYKGHDVADVTSLPSDIPLWQTVQVPSSYLVHQWPIKVASISPDGKYVAVAGRRGLAHYNVHSARWKAFEDPQAENEFAVRGGMCWHHHILIAAVETGGRHQIRLYSRDKTLHYSHILHIEPITSAAISTTVTGIDSLLVYTHDNVLLHYIIVMSASNPKLVQVGQIGFHGIIRAPTRVRTISWILPEDQLEHGDPSQDVARATVLFLVDGKLVLLQPSTNEQGELKYDMRVIAQNVEYYVLLRDQPSSNLGLDGLDMESPTSNGIAFHGDLGHSLRDSLWYFDGTRFNVWSDIQDVMACAPAELGRDLPPAVAVPVDFYPLSAVVPKGIVSGIDADLVQRRDTNFGFFRHAPRTQLFLPQLLRYDLGEFNSPAALHLSNSYQMLPYFPHALEVLLHDVLDSEVDNPPSPPETALLPTVLSFLSSFPSFLDVVVNCTRKTELRSWRTLFSYLPPVSTFLEQSLAKGKLNTAAGYLLVLYAFEQDAFQLQEFSRLLQLAVQQQEWELCKELARFLVGIDGSGEVLDAALAAAGLRPARTGSVGSMLEPTARPPQRGSDAGRGRQDSRVNNGDDVHPGGQVTPADAAMALDYFSVDSHVYGDSVPRSNSRF